jgi:Agenet domain
MVAFRWYVIPPLWFYWIALPVFLSLFILLMERFRLLLAVDDTASSTNYARSFGPSYSVFIQLQNTTREMGATAICPGSHYCTDGPISAFCEEAKLHGVNEHGVSRGDALIMNMNSYHRGSAHIDYGGLDRIMLILTFSPKPSRRAETRQMSQGITFQLRWDMWGHTLNDLANANKVMVQPWVTLKSLGLYKLPGTSWGIDYITSSAQRIVSVDNGFRRYDLVYALESGGLKWVPTFLRGKFSSSESWYEFLSRTLKLSLAFMKMVAVKALAGYVLAALVLSIPQSYRLRFLRNSMLRLLFVVATVFLLLWSAKTMVDSSGWGKDLKAKRKFTSVAKNEQLAFQKSCADGSRGRLSFCSPLPSTFPHQRDVLIETRLGTEKLAYFNNWLEGHPGNKLFRSLVDSVMMVTTFSSYPLYFKNTMAHYVARAVSSNQGRFLHQRPDGTWVRLSAGDVEAYTKQELWLQANPVAREASVWIRYLASDARFGLYRDTALVMDHTRRFLQDIECKILKAMHSSIGAVKDRSETGAARTKPFSPLQPLRFPGRTALATRKSDDVKDSSPQPTEPAPGAWIEEGDIVEAMTVTDADGGWYGARVLRVNALGAYTVEFGDGTVETVTLHQIRRVQEFKVGEEVDVLNEDMEYLSCEVLGVSNMDGTVTVMVLESEETVHGLSPLHMSRVGGYTPVKPDRSSPVYGLVEEATVEVLNSDENIWYTGVITNVDRESSDHEYTIKYVDGTKTVVSDARNVRPVTDYKPGEILTVYWKEEYQKVKFVAKLLYGSFQGTLLETGETVEGFTTLDVGITGKFAE